jgi:tRNA(His) 5'-end guanylyltransferase
MKVTATAVLKWVRQYALLNYEKPKPQQTTSVAIELDEVRHYLKSKKNKLWIWKTYCRTTRQLIDRECGDRDSGTL